ncbi:hypothetical protein N0V94_007159 [Neodidymelliopsis sp. IMI 364377]|nr:hypothetical protein N0V94_007159 [Neodidymelliopsis sp. IMI 364377]
MCDTTFTFGQRGGHFFDCPSRREIVRLPGKLTTFLSSHQIRQVHHVALGFEDSFLITWRDQDGQDCINSTGLPDELTNFLYARNVQRQLIRNIPDIRCVLGAYNSSFFVHDSSAYLWMSIPDGLLAALQDRIKNGSWIDKPRIVALGADDNFLLVTEKGAAIWDLDNYTTLSDMLEFSRTQDRGIQEIHSVTLHPYRYGCFIAHSKNGTLLFENLPPHQLSGLKSMINPIMRDTEHAGRQRVQRRESDKRVTLQRKPSALQERAKIRREWSEHKQQFTAQSKGLKLSLSLSIGVGGLARMLG